MVSAKIPGAKLDKIETHIPFFPLFNPTFMRRAEKMKDFQQPKEALPPKLSNVFPFFPLFNPIFWPSAEKMKKASIRR